MMLTGYHPKNADVEAVEPQRKDLPKIEDPYSLEDLPLDEEDADDTNDEDPIDADTELES